MGRILGSQLQVFSVLFGLVTEDFDVAIPARRSSRPMVGIHCVVDCISCPWPLDVARRLEASWALYVTGRIFRFSRFASMAVVHANSFFFSWSAEYLWRYDTPFQLCNDLRQNGTAQPEPCL